MTRVNKFDHINNLILFGNTKRPKDVAFNYTRSCWKAESPLQDYDVLRNDSQMLHKRLERLGIENELIFMKGSFHGQLNFSEQFNGTKYWKKSTHWAKHFNKTIKMHTQ